MTLKLHLMIETSNYINSIVVLKLDVLGAQLQINAALLSRDTELTTPTQTAVYHHPHSYLVKQKPKRDYKASSASPLPLTVQLDSLPRSDR